VPDFSCLLCYARSMAGGYTTENREGIYFLVTKLSDLKDKFLPTLLSLEYPVVGYKYIDFLYFKEAIEIMDKKLHFAYGTSSEEGLNKLRKIRQLLNSGPDYVVLPPASYGRRKDWLLLLTKYGSPPASCLLPPASCLLRQEAGGRRQEAGGRKESWLRSPSEENIPSEDTGSTD